MASRRPIRVGALLKNELSKMIQEGMAGPHEAIISITEVVMSPDLKSAKVFVSIYGDEKLRTGVLKKLSNSSSALKNELFRRVRLRHAPDLLFVRDDSLEKGSRVSELLSKIREEREEDERHNEDS